METEKKLGRPSNYSQEMVDSICQLLSEGYSLRAICRMEDMPGISSVMRWLSEYEEFREQYARARDIQADVLADEIIDIADRVIEENSAIAKARLQVDSRKWYASKLNPKKYGDKIQQEITSKVSEMTDEQINKRLAELVDESGAETRED